MDENTTKERYKILSTDNLDWNRYLGVLPVEKQDVYFSSEYMKLYELNGDGKAVLFVYERDGNTAIYPFMLNKICGYDLKEDFYDIQSAYGYGGPLASTNDKSFLNSFESEFLDYARANNIVAEFVRFHPLMDNHGIFANNIDVSENRLTVGLDLTPNIDDIFRDDISYNGRYCVRHSQKFDMQLKINQDISIFVDLYRATMDRLGADSYYYFSEKYFDAIEKSPFTKILSILLNGEIVASSLVMLHKNYAHYHLACSSGSANSYNSNYFLQWETIKYAKNAGCAYYHLGGGRSRAEDDSLLKYKKKFAKNLHKFYIGKRVHNPKIYSYLMQKWESKNSEKSKIFLQYRNTD